MGKSKKELRDNSYFFFFFGRVEKIHVIQCCQPHIISLKLVEITKKYTSPCNQNIQWKVLGSWLRQYCWSPSFFLSVLPPSDWPFPQTLQASPSSSPTETKSSRLQRFILRYLREKKNTHLIAFIKGERLVSSPETPKHLLLPCDLILGNMLLSEPITWGQWNQIWILI